MGSRLLQSGSLSLGGGLEKIIGLHQLSKVVLLLTDVACARAKRNHPIIFFFIVVEFIVSNTMLAL